MITDRPIVFVVDDDDSVRKALDRLLRIKGYRVATFASAEEFLGEPLEMAVGCLVLDLQLPGLDGLELQKSLFERGVSLPIVFVTGHGTIPTAIRAVKSGAMGFLTKPFSETELIVEIENALAVCRNQFAERAELERIRQCFGTLTKRESQILSFVVTGKLNKQTAAELGIVTNTVKVHRRRVMRKMHAESLADLVVMAQKIGLSGASSSAQLQQPVGC
jgi:FixJ family two-component response regulator